ncbi:MAG: hypothetical protein ACYC5M_04135 [Anaerolineae bacterium]
MLKRPLFIYNNWSSYDELSDVVELTEELALRQLDELLRLRRQGVRFDGYMMDAFWYASDGGYRTWRQPHWPQGPDRWLDGCLENGIMPGLWVATNTLPYLDVLPAWQSSLDSTGIDAVRNGSMCLFSGGYLEHFSETMHLWYERGVRMFKFDFADLGAAPERLKRVMLPSEIRAANAAALRGMLKAFRAEHPEVILVGYNGLDELPIMARTDYPLRKAVDSRWLDAFDTLYSGDPRPADVPATGFWRSVDIYSNHMVRYFQHNDLPLERIDSCSAMGGLTGTCYRRGAQAWRGMLVLAMARGGWMNVYHGNLELLTDLDGVWFAKVQRLYLDLQAHGRVTTFGPLPGSAQPYGFAALKGADGLLTVVNPSQSVASLGLPAEGDLRILFHDAGYTPSLQGTHIILGPEQMAVVGVGAYATPENDLGIEADVVIPMEITPLPVVFASEGDKAIVATMQPPEDGVLRIIMRQQDAHGMGVRSSLGSERGGRSVAEVLQISVRQGETDIPVVIHYDRPIWSGLSWGVGEVDCARLPHHAPLTVRCATSELRSLTLSAEVYHVRYEQLP